MQRVWTDGSCYPNPGPGGWAWATDEVYYAYGYEQQTTNNRMEMTAAIQALSHSQGPVEIISDSQYVTKAFTEGWIGNWERRGWRRKGEDIPNLDLWKVLKDLTLGREIKWTWVKGHAGNHMNEFVDELCGLGRTSKATVYHC